MTNRLALLLALALVIAGARAGETRNAAPPPPAAPAGHVPAGTAEPPVATIPIEQLEQELEPEVVITTKGETRFEEYRLGGRAYMIKVTPARGLPYFLVDEEGRGEFVRHDGQARPRPPMWIIKRF